MNWLLPAPKSVNKTGDEFVPHLWRYIQFPKELTTAVNEVLQLAKEKWDTSFIKKNRGSDDQIYTFWLGTLEDPIGMQQTREDNQIPYDKQDAYFLHVQREGIFAYSASLAGLFYALQTLKQIIIQNKWYEQKIIDWSDLLWRGVHVDSKGERPGYEGLKKTIKEWSHYKINLVLFEYEATFPYIRQPEIVGPDAYTTHEIEELQQLARDHFITIIPLVQSIGHVEYILQNPHYALLRENGEITQFCSSQEYVFQLIGELIEEVAEAHPNSPWIHIGGDEAWYLGGCTDCADIAAKHGAARLYIDHMNKVVQLVKDTGKRPIIWDDVLRRMENREEIERLDRSCIIHYWDYQTCGNPLNTDWIRYLQSLGFQVIGGAAMRGASGMDSSCPNFKQRYRNVKDWGFTANRLALPGVIATSWGRYGTLKPLIEPFDLGWYGALAAGEHFWNTKGIQKDDFNQRFDQVFLGGTNHDFPKWLKRFEKGLPYKSTWFDRRYAVSGSLSGNFLSLLDLMWKWRSEEQFFSRKLELLEARLYRVEEELFPDWERWRMSDRTEELKDHILNFASELHPALVDIVGQRWANEYIRAFTQKYLFRVENLFKSFVPPTPRQPETLVKIGTDYG
ncbi:family 20 glycosylhydrolase [Ammoniphilus resinae]|uniref:Beta-N-acetylhexosaminidase n=1 Tax=Ammoniphilus resinae TaxID=861532 RepID=A0ABS4GLC0_9BACL|nr:family 20 glycosylhydrolase [Ammoniphilus resinae]MBP1931070.1 hypothetical protein [Ammoniphilus resinae]